MSFGIGSKGDMVKQIQTSLKEAGFDSGPIDGVFSKNTRTSVLKFQESKNLVADGIVGPITLKELGIDAKIPTPELERENFKLLVASNPNYFGNMVGSPLKPVKKIAANTKYEELTCIGLNPKMDLLEATIQIKLPYGYGGNLCSSGTIEYIRFFIDYGDGWENLGLVGINVHDIPNGIDCNNRAEKPLSYSASLPIQPKRACCDHPMLPNVRAILSWSSEPPEDNPAWIPPWGNILERNVQIRPALCIKWPDLIKNKLKLPDPNILIEVVPEIEKALPGLELKAHSFEDLVKLYAIPSTENFSVEPHRFGSSEIQAEFVQGPSNLQLIKAKMDSWKKLGVDWAKAAGQLNKTKANVSYEELSCLGLDYNRDYAVAIVHIKKPLGYCGDLCHKGGKEYVAFWADWNDTCNWTYLDTVQIEVHDISTIPAGGLYYAAILPVSLDKYRVDCDIPKIARLRAVLSWNTPPSTTQSYALPYWGNRLDAHIHIKPGQPHLTGVASITKLGGVGIAEINTSGNGKTKPSAMLMPWGTPADYWDQTRECPFGGSVLVHGDPNVGFKYCVKVRKFGSLIPTIISDRIRVMDKDGNGSWHYADPITGIFDYMSDDENFEKTLADWKTTDNGLWEICLELYDAHNPPALVGTTPWYRILLDNKNPTAEINLDKGMCEIYSIETDLQITGTFKALDENFGHFKLYTLPLSMSLPAPMTGGVSEGNFETTAVNGDKWVLNIATMIQCGYVVRVEVWDRTIRNSQPGSYSHNWSADDKGFCLINKKK